MAKYTFTESAARRIAAATLAHERGNRDAPAVQFRRSGGGDDGVFRLGKTTAIWNKDTLAAIAIYEQGTPPNETSSSATLEGCVNKFATVASGKWVIVALAGNGSYYLIAAECA